MFTPAPSNQKASRSGVIAFQYQISDDGKTALVELVGISRNDLLPVLSAVDPLIKVFEGGKHTRVEIETEFKKHKKNFTFDRFFPVSAQ